MKLANPVASLISVPLQHNIDYGIGQDETYRFTLNIQPVVPFTLSERWNLITRTIIPVVSAGAPVAGVQGASGLGDIVQSFFVSPRKPVAGLVMGVGPALLYPTATASQLGGGRWAAGPTAVVLTQRGAITVGGLVNHLKAYAGDDARPDVHATTLNPFVTYVTQTKTTFALSPELVYDWVGGQWVAPVNVTVSQLLLVAGRPLSVGGGARVYLDGPAGGPAWGLRLSVTLLFPK